MADLANLVLAVDSTQVKTGTAALDGLTAAGARAEAASIGFGAGVKGAGVEAAAMATAAQASARAAMDQAVGFKVATEAARVNTMTMRETLVVARELSRGNFTRIPGSLTLLAQGISSQGGGIGGYASALLQTLGIIKTVQNAELAEAAAEAQSAAASVRGAAEKAAANIMAADTQLALAQAAVRVAETDTAAAAAAARVAAANDAVAAAAAEAAVAENALAVAMGRASEAGAAAAATTRTAITGLGIGVLGLGTAAVGAFAAFKDFQQQVKDDGDLTRYRDSLGLTHKEMLRLSDGVEKVSKGIKELGPVTVTFGDVMHGVWKAMTDRVADSTPWKAFSSAVETAFTFVIKAIDKLIGFAVTGLNVLIAGTNLVSGSKFQLLQVSEHPVANFFKDVGANAEQHARDRMDAEAAALKADRSPKKPKKPKDHGLQEALDKLDAEIKGQYALAAAYDVSDAAVQRAAAHQKAAEDAISHKANAQQQELFYQKELQKAVATDVAQAAKKNADLQFETSERSRLNAEIAAGTITVTQANEQLKLQTKLRSLNADLENADAAHKQAVRDIIKQTIDLENEQLQLESQLSALKQIAANDNEIAKMQLENSLLGASNRERATALAQLEAMQKLKEIDPNGLLTGRERSNYIQSEVDRATAGIKSPFQQWASTIPQTADAINEALEGIKFRGFDALAQGITDVVTGTKSLGAAFKDISRQIIGEILQMTVKMLIFRAVSSIFGGGIGAPNIGASASVDTVSPLASVPLHFASGGSMIVGGNGGVDNNVLSLNGSPVAKVSQGETLAVYPNGRAAANNNSPQQIELKIGFGAAPDFAPFVETVAGGYAAQAIKVSTDHTNNTIKSLRRPSISGGGR